MIAWDDILDVRRTRFGLIEIDLADEAAFWESLSPMKQLARMKWALFGYGPALIAPWGLNESRGRLVDLLERELDERLILRTREERALQSGATDVP